MTISLSIGHRSSKLFVIEDAEGRAIYFPGGLWTRGRILATSEIKARVQVIRTRYQRTGIALSFAFMATLGLTAATLSKFPEEMQRALLRYMPLALFAVALIPYAAYRRGMHEVLQGCPISDKRLFPNDAAEVLARIENRGNLWFMTLLTLVVLATGTWLAFATSSPTVRAIAILGMLGPCLFLMIYAKALYRQRNIPADRKTPPSTE